MPKIAQYGDAQVRTQVVSQPQMSAAAGSAVFQANIQAAQGLAKLASEGVNMMQRIDTTSAEEALVEFEREKNKALFDPDNGYFNTQGRNAYDNASTASETIAKLQEQYGAKLNQNAKAMFDKAASVHVSRAQGDIMRHASKGLQAWEVATIEAQVENTVENATLYWNQPDQLAVQNALGRQAILDAAEISGIGPEATAEKLQTYDSSFAKAAIAAATSKSATEGEALLAKMEKRLEGPDVVKVKEAIAAKKQAEHTQYIASQAIAQGTRLVNTYDSRSQILEEANKISDDELRAKTVTEAMRQFDRKKQAEAEEQAATFERAETHLFDGGSAETFKAEDPEGWQRLSAKQKKALEKGESVTTDWTVYSDLMMLPKEELAKVNPAEYIDSLAPAQRTSLITAVKTAKGTSTTSEKVDNQVGRTRTAQTSAAIEQILGKKATWNDDKRVKANAFYDLLDGEVKHREKLKGGNLSSQEFTDVLSELTREVTIKRSAFGVDFLAPDAEQDVTEIPPENLRVLSQFLRDNGVPVTAENLLKAQRQASQ